MPGSSAYNAFNPFQASFSFFQKVSVDISEGGTTSKSHETIDAHSSAENVEWGDDITDDDRTIIGKDVPDFTYGININLQWKNFELSALGLRPYL